MPPPWWKDKYKPPAAFSSNAEFLGYVVGDANSPYSIVVFNNGFRYPVNLTTGYLQPKLSTPYTDGYMTDLYDYQYRGNDLICGFNDPTLSADSRPVNYSYARTTPSGAIPGSTITHFKSWSGMSWSFVPVPLEVRSYLAQFTFHRWVQVTNIPFSVPISLPVTISVDY